MPRGCLADERTGWVARCCAAARVSSCSAQGLHARRLQRTAAARAFRGARGEEAHRRGQVLGSWIQIRPVRCGGWIHVRVGGVLSERGLPPETTLNPCQRHFRTTRRTRGASATSCCQATRQRLVDLARPQLAVPWRAVLSRSGPRGAVNHQTKTRAASGVRACGAASIPRCCEAAAPQRAGARGLVRVVQCPGEKARLLAAWNECRLDVQMRPVRYIPSDCEEHTNIVFTQIRGVAACRSRPRLVRGRLLLFSWRWSLARFRSCPLRPCPLVSQAPSGSWGRKRLGPGELVHVPRGGSPAASAGRSPRQTRRKSPLQQRAMPYRTSLWLIAFQTRQSAPLRG